MGVMPREFRKGNTVIPLGEKIEGRVDSVALIRMLGDVAPEYIHPKRIQWSDRLLIVDSSTDVLVCMDGSKDYKDPTKLVLSAKVKKANYDGSRDTYRPANSLPRLTNTIFSGCEDQAYDTVAHAIAYGISIKDAELVCKEGDMVLDFGAGLGSHFRIMLFDPTESRVADAMETMNEFYAFVDQHAADICDAASLVYKANQLYPRENASDTSRQYLLEARKNLIKGADEIIASLGLSPVSFDAYRKPSEQVGLVGTLK